LNLRPVDLDLRPKDLDLQPMDMDLDLEEENSDLDLDLPSWDLTTSLVTGLLRIIPSWSTRTLVFVVVLNS